MCNSFAIGYSNFLPNLISEVLSLGGIIPPSVGKKIQNQILVPIINGDIALEDIESEVTNQLESLLATVKDDINQGLTNFATFFEKISPDGNRILDDIATCPTATVANPNYFKANLPKIIQLYKDIKETVDHGKKILKDFKKLQDCRTYTIAVALEIEAFATFGKGLGLFITFNFDNEFKIQEIGTVKGVSTSVDPLNGPDLDLSVGGTISFMMGDKDVWGEWGYTFSFGASVPVNGVGVGLSAGLIFTADNETKALGGFIGIALSTDVSLGQASTSVDFDASMECGYDAAKSIKDALEPKTCTIEEQYDQFIEGMKEVGDLIEEKFENAYKMIESCASIYTCEATQCMYNIDPENYLDCKKMENTCGDKLDTCLEWKSKCEKK